MRLMAARAGRDADPRALRNRLLDAAADLIVRHGYRGLRMRDVADAVGVSRQTVYNEFGDKWGLARTLVLRDTERFLDGIDEALSRHDDLGTAVTEAVAYALDEAADDPLLKAALTGDGSEELLPLLTTRAEPQLFAARARLIAHLRRHWPGLPADDVAAVCDAAVRLTMSHMITPGEPAQIVAVRVARMVTSYLRVPPHGPALPSGAERTPGETPTAGGRSPRREGSR